MLATNLYLIIEETQKKICEVTSAGFKPRAIIINNSHAAILNKAAMQGRNIVNPIEIFNLPVIVDNQAREIIIGVV